MFGKKGTLSLRFIGPLESPEKYSDVTYRLALPLHLSVVHLVFYISMLKRYHLDDEHIIQQDSTILDHDLSFEENPTVILDRKTRKMRSKYIDPMKVQWIHSLIKDGAWELESDMRLRYPKLLSLHVFYLFFSLRMK